MEGYWLMAIMGVGIFIGIIDIVKKGNETLDRINSQSQSETENNL